MTLLTRRVVAALTTATATTILSAPRIARAQAALVRVGWIPTTPVQAQIAHVLDRTDIPQRNDLRAQMTMFVGSPAVNEALASGAIDIGFVSDFAAITIMAAGAPIIAVAHQSRFRGAVMAASHTPIASLADLRGRTVFGLFGVTVYQSALEAVRRAGLTPGRDVTFANMGFTELADALRARRIEAFFTWDPWIAFFESQGFARTLAQDTAPTMMIMARETFMREQPAVLRRFLRAHSEALFFAGRNRGLVNGWFRQPEAARQIPEEVIETASAFDPNWSAPSFESIRLALGPEQIERLQGLAQFALDNRLAQRLAPVAQRVNVEIAASVDQEAASRPFDPALVQVLQRG